jgi:hypothetical protein
MERFKEFISLHRPAVTTIAIAIAAIVWISLAIGGHKQSPRQTAPTAKTTAAQTSKSKPEPAPMDISIGVVHAGEGIEHALIRQLMANPDLLANPGAFAKLGLKAFTGNRTDKASLKKWAGTQADLLAHGAGYFGPKFHEEIHVQLPGIMSYMIEKDSANGNLSIVEYPTVPMVAPPATPGTTTVSTKGHPGSTLTPISSHAIATTLAAAHFIGPQDGTTILPAPYRSYEYMFVG